MSRVVWELKQHPYSGCLVLGQCYWVVNCNFHMNWLDVKLQEVFFYKTPPFWFKVYPKGFPELVCGSPFCKHLTQHHWSQWVWSNISELAPQSKRPNSMSCQKHKAFFWLYGNGFTTLYFRGRQCHYRSCFTFQAVFHLFALQNQSLTFPVFILIQTFVSQVSRRQIHCLLFVHLCLSSRQVPTQTAFMCPSSCHMKGCYWKANPQWRLQCFLVAVTVERKNKQH